MDSKKKNYIIISLDAQKAMTKSDKSHREARDGGIISEHKNVYIQQTVATIAVSGEKLKVSS